MNVYCLTFPNGKRYFGVENKTGQRIASHKSNAKRWRTQKRPQLVSKAIDKHGWGNVVLSYIGEDMGQDEALALEASLIREHQTTDPSKGYNIDPGGGFYRRGVKASIETRAKQSASLKALNRTMPEDHKEKLREIQRTRLRTSEERAKISATLTGRKRSQVAIDKHREKMKGRKLSGSQLEGLQARNSERNKRPISEETRRKMSESAKKRKASDETRRKISEGNKGKTLSDEHRAKLSQAHLGKKKSAEHLAKIGQALKGRTVHNAGKRRITLPDGTQAYVPKNELDQVS